MAGHLFITRGDLRRLACDAILVPSGTGPSGRRGHILAENWIDLDLGLSRAGYVSNPPGPTQRVKLHRRARAGRPAIWLGHSGDDDLTVNDLEVVVRAFVAQAGRSRRHLGGGRRQPLVALPFLGTGGGRLPKDEVVKRVVASLGSAVVEHDVDVALVLFTDAQYAACQQARRRYVSGPNLKAGERKTLDRLAEEARAGRLVLFMGAGIGRGAGLPDWNGLLDHLLRDARVSDSERKGLAEVDNRDVGELLRGRLEDLNTRIVELTNGEHVSLVHQLLASLPVHEAITTNYDQMFERAWCDAGRSPAVLPSAETDPDRDWLLKLHGSVDDPGSIVLSRTDYLRFDQHSPALAGIVQAMLLTKHMLFVGYSLSDDNFHRIVHQVRDATQGRSTKRRLGTVLTPSRATIVQEIWGDDLEFLNTDEPEGDGARRLAIVLDQLAAETAPAGRHLLDRGYAGVFRPAERVVCDRMEALWSAATNAEVRPELTKELGRALALFGVMAKEPSRDQPIDTFDPPSL